MPQRMCVVSCCECSTHQVQQIVKAKRWACKMCGFRQSFLKVLCFCINDQLWYNQTFLFETNGYTYKCIPRVQLPKATFFSNWIYMLTCMSILLITWCENMTSLGLTNLKYVIAKKFNRYLCENLSKTNTILRLKFVRMFAPWLCHLSSSGSSYLEHKHKWW